MIERDPIKEQINDLRILLSRWKKKYIEDRTYCSLLTIVRFLEFMGF